MCFHYDRLGSENTFTTEVKASSATTQDNVGHRKKPP